MAGNSFLSLSRSRLALPIFSVVVFASSALAYDAVPGQFLVELKSGGEVMNFSELSARLDAKVLENVRDNVILVQRSVVEKSSASIAALQVSPYVEVAEPNYIYRAVKTPNDSSYGRLWGMKNSGQVDSKGNRGVAGIDVSAERAWDITTGSKSVIVAVIDTGVDFSIPDLAPNAWVNTTEKNGRAGVDDDQNGLVDDVNGWDFASNRANGVDDNGHGSHCAGTIGAKGNDGTGVAGVNWDVSIMAVKFLDKDGGGTLANAVKSIDYARKMGAKIMSNSWGGGGPSATLQKAIENARDAGILFVAAAGNDGSDNDAAPTYPASYNVDNIISVAAIDNRGELASFSNFGRTTVDIAAPGVNVLSTTPTGLDSYSGTSMATPHVSGVAALLASENLNWGWREMKTRLLESARPIANLRGRVASAGMVDAYYALTGQAPPADPNDPSAWTNRGQINISSAHPYADKASVSYTVRMPGAKRMAIHFAKFETEAGYDKLQIANAAGDVMGVMSGKHDGRYSPIVEGDTIVLTFTSDDSVSMYGFDIDQVVYEP